MRLYANEAMNQWRGTQADAKAAFGTVNQIDVPTDKLGLLEFLNNYSTVPEADKRVEQSVEETIIQVRQAKYERENAPKPNDSIVGRCSMVELKELSTTLKELLFRTWSETEKHHEAN